MLCTRRLQAGFLAFSVIILIPVRKCTRSDTEHGPQVLLDIHCLAMEHFSRVELEVRFVGFKKAIK